MQFSFTRVAHTASQFLMFQLYFYFATLTFNSISIPHDEPLLITTRKRGEDISQLKVSSRGKTFPAFLSSESIFSRGAYLVVQLTVSVVTLNY